MRTLDEAWKWYEETKQLLVLMKRLGDRYWADLPWDGKLARDDAFRDLDGNLIVEMADDSLEHFDDLAIVFLFATFEISVRDHVMESIVSEASLISHPLLKHAIEGAISTIKKGSILTLLEGFKRIDHSLVEEVSQVRQYRNWVAHGKRGREPGFVDPGTAFTRLVKFLNLLDSENV